MKRRPKEIVYRGDKRYVRLDVSSTDPKAIVGAWAILTSPMDPTQPPLTVRPALYPNSSRKARKQFDAACDRATLVATQLIRGGASLVEAKEIVSAFLRNEVHVAELKVVAPYVRIRKKTNRNLKKKEKMLSRAQCERAVSQHETRTQAAAHLGISTRHLRRLLSDQ